MTDVQGSFGRTRVFEDFLGGYDDTSAWAATGVGHLGGVSFTSVNEGAVAVVADEPGGVVTLTTDTGSADNIALFVGKFQPSLGGCVMETRIKNPDALTTRAIFVGFAETLALDTPVMPLEFDTITMTYNGSGGIVGFSYDTGGTVDTWRAAAGDVGVATGGSSNGTVSGQGAPVADEWDIFRVEIGDEGTGRCYHDGVLIDTFETAVTATDKFFAVVMIETRSGANEILEVDYVYAAGGRDWNVA